MPPLSILQVRLHDLLLAEHFRNHLLSPADHERGLGLWLRQLPASDLTDLIGQYRAIIAGDDRTSDFGMIALIAASHELDRHIHSFDPEMIHGLMDNLFVCVALEKLRRQGDMTISDLSLFGVCGGALVANVEAMCQVGLIVQRGPGDTLMVVR